jgi:hypothetical protein
MTKKLERIYEWEIGSGFIGYDSLPTYEKMLYSIKPLKPKYYLSEEHYELLKPYFNK